MPINEIIDGSSNELETYWGFQVIKNGTLLPYNTSYRVIMLAWYDSHNPIFEPHKNNLDYP